MVIVSLWLGVTKVNSLNPKTVTGARPVKLISEPAMSSTPAPVVELSGVYTPWLVPFPLTMS